MGRPKGSTNSKYYHYEIHHLTETGEMMEHKYFISQKDIANHFNISMSLVNRLIADPTYTPRDKTKNIRIFRIQQEVKSVEQHD